MVPYLKVYKEAHTSPPKKKNGQFLLADLSIQNEQFGFFNVLSTAAKVLCTYNRPDIRLRVVRKQGQLKAWNLETRVSNRHLVRETNAQQV